MIDVLETVIAYLASDADLNTLTGSRIAAKHKFGDGWALPSKAVQVQYDGGTPDLYTERQLVRIEVRCFGESQVEASKLFRAMVGLSRTTERVRVPTNDGFALLYWLLPLSAPSFFFDSEAKLDVILFFLQACVSEIDIP